MKYLDKIIVSLFTLCLIILSVLIPINIIATSKSFYQNQMTKSGTYAVEGETVSVRYIGGDSSQTAELTNEHCNKIIDHITAYLSHKKDSFALRLENVSVNGTVLSSIDIFGEKAVTHMDDVRPVFDRVKTASVVIAALTLILMAYMLLRKATVRKVIFKYSVITFCVFLSLFVVFGVICYILLLTSDKSISAANYFYQLWVTLHHLFFPFDPDRFQGSIFNDTLTSMLNINFFIRTVLYLVLNLAATSAAWLFSAKLISKK